MRIFTGFSFYVGGWGELREKEKGTRLSLVSVGRLYLGEVLKEVMIDLAWVRANFPEVELRNFAWIHPGGKEY